MFIFVTVIHNMYNAQVGADDSDGIVVEIGVVCLVGDGGGVADTVDDDDDARYSMYIMYTGLV